MARFRWSALAARTLPILLVSTLAACGGNGTSVKLPAQNGGQGDGLTVSTDKGSVRGEFVNGVRKFLGIPYAAAPTGTLRFEPPQPRPAWATTLNATSFGSPCPQGGPPVAPFGFDQETNEDCLNLNVTTPSGGAGLPVMVWIHGGAYSQGGGAFYPADSLVNTGHIVVVTINYRLGILGYLALPALDAQGNGTTGNYGIEDQIAALKWVHTNIANFGGNPNNVTIAGESAGGASVCILNENAASGGAASGLFVRGIVESGPCEAPLQTFAQAEQTGAAAAAALGCPTAGSAAVQCLQSPTFSIKNAIAALNTLPLEALSPSAGSFDIPQQPKAGIGHMPLLLGGNKFEWGLFVGIDAVFGLQAIPQSATDYNNFLESAGSSYGAAGSVVAASPQYNWNVYNNNGFNALTVTESDFAPAVPIALCYDFATEQKQSASGQAIYAFEFSDLNAPSTLPFAPFIGVVPGGPVHASEVQYVWPGTTAPPSLTSTGPALTGAEATLSNQMVTYWSNFVKTGNPNGSGLPNWPTFKAGTDVMQLNNGAAGTPTALGAGTVDFDAEHNCSSFWEPLFAPTGLLN